MTALELLRSLHHIERYSDETSLAVWWGVAGVWYADLEEAKTACEQLNVVLLDAWKANHAG